MIARQSTKNLFRKMRKRESFKELIGWNVCSFSSLAFIWSEPTYVHLCIESSLKRWFDAIYVLFQHFKRCGLKEITWYHHHHTHTPADNIKHRKKKQNGSSAIVVDIFLITGLFIYGRCGQMLDLIAWTLIADENECGIVTIIASNLLYHFRALYFRHCMHTTNCCCVAVICVMSVSHHIHTLQIQICFFTVLK